MRRGTLHYDIYMPQWFIKECLPVTIGFQTLGNVAIKMTLVPFHSCTRPRSWSVFWNERDDMSTIIWCHHTCFKTENLLCCRNGAHAMRGTEWEQRCNTRHSLCTRVALFSGGWTLFFIRSYTFYIPFCFIHSLLFWNGSTLKPIRGLIRLGCVLTSRNMNA